MPKMKSHSGAKKRFRKSGGGKWRHARAGCRHLLTPQRDSTARRRGTKNTLNNTAGKILERFLPYA